MTLTIPSMALIDPVSKRFKLLEDWVLDLKVGYKILVPAGFETDLASIPSVLFFCQWGAWNLAAIVHDFACDKGFIFCLDSDSNPEKITLRRSQADRLFLELMLDLRVAPFLAYPMFWAVSLAGKTRLF